MKIKFMHIFRDKKVIDKADLIVTRIEGSGTYFIHKNRGERLGLKKNSIISQDNFNMLLCISIRPLVLSDTYIDLELKV